MTFDGAYRPLGFLLFHAIVDEIGLLGKHLAGAQHFDQSEMALSIGSGFFHGALYAC